MKAAYLLFAVAIVLTAQNQVSDSDPFVGSFRGDGATLDLRVNGGVYTGSLGIRGSFYPVRLKLASSIGTGTYEVNGQVRNFTVTREGDGLLLDSGGAAYRLSRRESSTLAPAAPDDVQTRRNW